MSITIYNPDGTEYQCPNSPPKSEKCEDVDCTCPDDGGVYFCIFDADPNEDCV